MICRAAKQDTKTVARLAAKMWTDSTEEELSAEFEAILADEKAAVFLYFENSIAIGFAQCQLRNDYVEGTSSSPVGYLEGIFVEGEYREQGCAKLLLDACEQWAKEHGCVEFASDCELNNARSLAFHLGCGFTEANRIICFTKQI